MVKDPYSVLGVERTADASEIKRAYRALSLELHPDRNPGDAVAEERFKDVSTAYDVLGDVEKRRKYDAYGPASLSVNFKERVAPPPPGQHFTVTIKIPWLLALRGGTHRETVAVDDGTRDVKGLVPAACFASPPTWVFPGRGGAGEPPGNLVVHTQVSPSDVYAVLDNTRDIAMSVDVTVLDLLAARHVVVTTPWSQVVLVPTLLRDRTGLALATVNGHGVRRPGSSGNLVVSFRLELPPRDVELERLLRRLQPPRP